MRRNALGKLLDAYKNPGTTYDKELIDSFLWNVDRYPAYLAVREQPDEGDKSHTSEIIQGSGKWSAPISMRYLTSDELLRYFTYDYTNLPEYLEYDSKDLCELAGRELARRNAIRKLLNVFENPGDIYDTECTARVLTGIESRQVYKALMRRGSLTPDRTAYLCLYHLASRGNRNALRLLYENKLGYGMPSYELANAVWLFGRFHYEPAIPDLIGSLNAMSLNLGGAAYHSLRQLFPGSPDDLGPSEAEAYFTRRFQEMKDKRMPKSLDH